jgi:predicted helicase
MLLPHQLEALDHARKHFLDHNRGMLVMACGSGKSLVSHKIAEQQINAARAGQGGGLIVFFAPSIALIGQTLREWSGDADPSIYSVCVCSDADVSRAHAKKEQDENQYLLTELPLPAVTDPSKIKHQLEAGKLRFPDRNQVIFSTYQSIDKVEAALKLLEVTADFCCLR